MNQRSLTRRMSVVVTVVMCSAFYLFLLAPHVRAQYTVELDAHATLDSFLVWYDQYSAECSFDTIHADPYEGEFIVDRGAYRELITEKQLEQYGYKYKFRWLKKIAPTFEWDYVFLKEETLPGFILWLRRKQLRK